LCCGLHPSGGGGGGGGVASSGSRGGAAPLWPRPAPPPLPSRLPGVRAAAWRTPAAAPALPLDVALGSTGGRTAARQPWCDGGGGADTLLPPRRRGRQGANSRKRQHVTKWQKVKLGGEGGRVKEGLLSLRRNSTGVRGGGGAGRATWTDPGTIVSNFVLKSVNKTRNGACRNNRSRCGLVEKSHARDHEITGSNQQCKSHWLVNWCIPRGEQHLPTPRTTDAKVKTY